MIVEWIGGRLLPEGKLHGCSSGPPSPDSTLVPSGLPYVLTKELPRLRKQSGSVTDQLGVDMPKPTPITVRFWSKVDQSGECWLWTGSHQPNGYPKFNATQGGGYAHRASYVLNVGPIPDGMTIDHMCDTPSCVRPDHLRLATQQENILRSTGPAAVNARKTHCSNGHSLADAYISERTTRRQCRQCCVARSKAYRAKLAS